MVLTCHDLPWQIMMQIEVWKLPKHLSIGPRKKKTWFCLILSFILFTPEQWLWHNIFVVVVIQLLSYVKVFVTPQTTGYQAPLSMGFPRQEYWNGLPFHSPGDLPNSGIEPTYPSLVDRFFTTEPPGSPTTYLSKTKITAVEMRSNNLLRLTEWQSQDLTLSLLKKQVPVCSHVLLLKVFTF